MRGGWHLGGLGSCRRQGYVLAPGNKTRPSRRRKCADELGGGNPAAPEHESHALPLPSYTFATPRLTRCFWISLWAGEGAVRKPVRISVAVPKSRTYPTMFTAMWRWRTASSTSTSRSQADHADGFCEARPYPMKAGTASRLMMAGPASGRNLRLCYIGHSNKRIGTMV